MRSRLVFGLALLALACGGAQQEPEYQFPPPPPPAPAPPPSKKPALPPGVLLRADVVLLLDKGFGRFLQRVDVQPAFAEGRFRGWTIVALRPAEWWEGVDLKPGDVVTSVNGMPIERDNEGLAAFESVRTGDRLTVSYLRGTEPRTLEYKIVEKL